MITVASIKIFRNNLYIKSDIEIKFEELNRNKRNCLLKVIYSIINLKK